MAHRVQRHGSRTIRRLPMTGNYSEMQSLAFTKLCFFGLLIIGFFMLVVRQ